jgi:hypothetical protein
MSGSTRACRAMPPVPHELRIISSEFPEKSVVLDFCDMMLTDMLHIAFIDISGIIYFL